MIDISCCKIIEQLYNGKKTVIYRGKRDSDGLPIILKLLKKKHPTYQELAAFKSDIVLSILGADFERRK